MKEDKSNKETKEEVKAQEQPDEETNIEKEEETLENNIDSTRSLLAETTDKYLRSLAELDNFRKRVQKDKEEFVKFAKSDIIREFLPVLDNLERAMDASKKNTQDIEQFKAGITMVIKQLKDAFTRMNVTEIKAEGIFNPDIHHVVHKEEKDDKKEGEIIEVYQKGYMFEDKMIRPAMVMIAGKK
jgi:molecular chaperone GrpE